MRKIIISLLFLGACNAQDIQNAAATDTKTSNKMIQKTVCIENLQDSRNFAYSFEYDLAKYADESTVVTCEILSGAAYNYVCPQTTPYQYQLQIYGTVGGMVAESYFSQAFDPSGGDCTTTNY